MTSTMYVDQAKVLSAIDRVISWCWDSQLKDPDKAVDEEIKDLQHVRSEVEQRWPLPEPIKAAIKIGPVAAKNIADWNSELANALMILHHVLKHDGDSIEKLGH